MKLNDYRLLNTEKVRSTLHEVSVDDSNAAKKEYMTDSTAEVINFDNVKREYMNSLGMSEEGAKSVDGLFQAKNASPEDAAIYMIEFKNGNIENRDIERKVRDSVLIFQSITGTQLEDTRKNVTFVLVYNSGKHKFDYRDMRAMAKANQGKVEFCRFGLAHLRGFCFKNVFAYSQQEFEKKIVPLVQTHKTQE